MRKIIVCFLAPCALMLLTGSCKKTGDAPATNPINVTVKTGEMYAYDLGLFGDEEGAHITQQASHFQQSEVSRLSDTHVIYTYVAAPGYKGTDDVVLQTARGSDGASPPKVVANITLHFTITN